MNKIALIAVAYNRIDSLTRLLHSLEEAYYGDEQPTLIISIDKSKTDIVEKFADEYKWRFGEKIVNKHEINLGLRNHMMSLGEWFNRFDSLVLLEDDIVVSPCFYSYVRQTSDKYINTDYIAGISLYNFEMNYHTCTPFRPVKNEYDVYFMNTAMSWGEVWMKPQWLKFYDWYKGHQDFSYQPHLPASICKWGKSWLKYHTRYCIENDKYFVYPYTSLSSNCSDAGTHNNGPQYNMFQVGLQRGSKLKYCLPDTRDDVICYDAFFENKALFKSLNIEEKDCCLDLYGIRKNVEKKRYWLTTCKADFPVIKSFAFSYKPMEINVQLNVSGSDIFLYDTSNNSADVKAAPEELLQRYNIDNITNLIRKYGIERMCKDFIMLVLKRIKK